MLVKAVEQLKEALHQEKLMYGQLLTLETDKTDVIKTGRVKQLEEMTKQEQKFLSKMGTFERIRRSVFVNAAEDMGVEEINGLSEFLLYLEDPEEIELLDQLRHELLDTIQRIHEVNQKNQQLMERHLEYIQVSLELMTDRLTQPADHNYGQGTGENKKTKPHLFDARV